MLRLLICDDQEVVREGLHKILDSDPEIEVVGMAQDGNEAVEMAASCQPDLILMDLKMPVMNGVQATRLIQKKHPQVKILVLTTYDDDEWLFDSIRSGAAGYLLKDTPRADLIKAIKGTMQGNTYIHPAVAGKLFSTIAQQNIPAAGKLNPDLFSDREKEVLTLLAKGYSNADIAAELFLSEGTVRNYTSTIFAKLGVSDRTQAAVIALREGWVDTQSE